MTASSITRRTFGLSVGAVALFSRVGVGMSQTLSAHRGKITPLTVSFASGDSYVVAHLYLPEGHDPAKRYPAVAVGGSFTSVKEQMGGIYGGEMARRGVMALAIDYRNYGQSGGAKRQYEDPAAKAEDLSAALRYLASRPDVSGTGLLGICTSGGTVLYTAAEDANVGAVATVAGFFSEPELVALIKKGPEAVERLRAEGRLARQIYDETGEIKTIRAYHNTDQTAASVSPSQYYLDQTRGGGVPSWRNEFAVMAWEPWIDFDPISRASRVTAPTLMIHSEGSAFPDQARKVYGLLAGPKELHWAEGAHFDFYDQSGPVGDAADRVAAHFRRTLG
ncbi:alpha/beta hydrolase [Rhizobium sp. RMa-01]|nr:MULTISPECIES: alpha/beta hydrolase [unclassified Rhizobium]RVU09789.1 alpha/beta hydrolase [Rhizobium sp. RMa-01]